MHRTMCLPNVVYSHRGQARASTALAKVWYEGERQSAGGTSQLPDPDVESSL